MFGEEMIFGQAQQSVDNKTRIIIPSFTKREEGEELGIIEDEDMGIYRIYKKNIIEKIYNEIQNKIDNAKTKEEKVKYKNEQYEFCKKIKKISKLDKQAKFLLGESFEGVTKVNLTGSGDHLILELTK